MTRVAQGSGGMGKGGTWKGDGEGMTRRRSGTGRGGTGGTSNAWHREGKEWCSEWVAEGRDGRG